MRLGGGVPHPPRRERDHRGAIADGHRGPAIVRDTASSAFTLTSDTSIVRSAARSFKVQNTSRDAIRHHWPVTVVLTWTYWIRQCVYATSFGTRSTNCWSSSFMDGTKESRSWSPGRSADARP